MNSDMTLMNSNIILMNSKIILMNSDMTMMNAPTEVIVNTFVRSIDKIDDYKMEWVFGKSNQFGCLTIFAFKLKMLKIL